MAVIGTNQDKKLKQIEDKVNGNMSSTYTPPDMTANINQLAEAQQTARLTALDRAKAKSLSELDREKNALTQPYYDAKNRAGAQNLMAAKSFRDYVAARGLKRSGVNDQFQMTNRAALQGELGALDRQYQEQLADIERRRSGIGTDYASQGTQAQAEIQAQKMQQLLDQGRYDQNQLLQIAGLTGYLPGGQETLASRQLQNQMTQQEIQNRMAEAGLTGRYDGKRTLAGQQFDTSRAMNEAGLTGRYNGQRTLAGQQFDQSRMMDQAQITGMYDGQRTLQGQQFDLNKDATIAGLTGNYGNQRTIAGQQLDLSKEGQKWEQDFKTGQFDWQKEQAAIEMKYKEKRDEIEDAFKNRQISVQEKNQALAELDSSRNYELKSAQLEIERKDAETRRRSQAASAAQTSQTGGFTNDDYYKYFNYYSDQLKSEWKDTDEGGAWTSPADKATVGKQIIGSSMPSAAKQALLKDLGITQKDLSVQQTQDINPFSPSNMQSSIWDRR